MNAELRTVMTRAGANACAVRNQTGWTQREAATRSGISVSTLQRIEAGVGNPRVNTLLAYIRALGVKVDEIF